MATALTESERPSGIFGEKGDTPFIDEGIDGTGEVVAISDSGLDVDNCYFIDPDNGSPPIGSPVDLKFRKIVQYTKHPNGDSSDYEDGHGTHVAGTSKSPKNINISHCVISNLLMTLVLLFIVVGKRYDGEGQADGVAPGAKLAVYDAKPGSSRYVFIESNRVLNTGAPHAKIHNGSWGSYASGIYGRHEPFFDEKIYEVSVHCVRYICICLKVSNPNDLTHTLTNFLSHLYSVSEIFNQNDELLVVMAAGNGGYQDAPISIGSPAGAKNVVAVGALNSWGPSSSSSSAGSSGPSFLAYFSSRGPTQDGRTKPDIVAPGFMMRSAAARPGQQGECTTTSKGGTSMAAPVVSGTAAKTRQYFREGYYPSGVKNNNDSITGISAALVKAILMNGAQSILGVGNPGVITSSNLYDNNQGFGRVSLQDSLYLAGKTNTQLKIWDRENVSDGSTNTYDVTIDKTGGCEAKQLSVTLVWMEEASSVGCTACVLHDLDLSVSFKGRTYFPNGRNSPDRTNNSERVIITGVEHGDTAIISVNAYNIAKSAQTFALVATACFGGVANTLDGESVYDLQQPTSTPSTSMKPSSSLQPTSTPSTSMMPSDFPSSAPSSTPSSLPSSNPSQSPSDLPSDGPSTKPSDFPSSAPSGTPTLEPSISMKPSDSSQPSSSSKPSLSLSPSQSKSSKRTKSSKIQETLMKSGCASTLIDTKLALMMASGTLFVFFCAS